VQINNGDAVSVRLDAYPGRELKGVISEVSSAADVRTGLFPAQVRLDPAPGLKLASGLVARIRIAPERAGTGTLVRVPISAIVEGDGRAASVFVVDGTTARKRAVQVRFLEAEQAAIDSGVRSGERLVTEGALYLVDGERIRIADGDARAAR
jgi:multidrug efflux pump subunit AcrA (membrane-fusion protein)